MLASDEARSPATRSEQPGGLRIEATVVHAGPTPETVPSADMLPSAAEQVVAYEREWQWRLENSAKTRLRTAT